MSGPPLMHGLALTDRHSVLFDLPVTFNPALARAGSRFPYAWSPGRPARLGLLPRQGCAASVRWFDIDPCYVFHPVNAYEVGDRCVVDVVRYDRVFDRDRDAPGESPPTLWRWTLDLTRGTVAAEQLDDIPQEFPRIDDRRKTMPHRYAYTVAMQSGTGVLGGSALLRHDLVRRTVAVHDFGPGGGRGRVRPAWAPVGRGRRLAADLRPRGPDRAQQPRGARRRRLHRSPGRRRTPAGPGARRPARQLDHRLNRQNA